MNKLINGEEYWNNRFLNDWNKYSGEEQTAFFARITCELLPEWLIKAIRLNKYTICDMGCACGEAVNILAQFLSTEVCGMDFSEVAIETAKQNFPAYHFTQGDVTNLDTDVKFDIIYCSNVLEHFYKPWDMAEKMAAAAKDYLILQMPFREKLSIDEHFYKFDTNIIPFNIADFTLVNLETINASEIPNTLYPDQQILLVYSSHKEDFKASRVSDICSGVQSSDLFEWNKESEIHWKNKINEIENANEVKLQAWEADFEELKNDYSTVKSEFNKREVLIEKISKDLADQTNVVTSVKEELIKQQELIASLTQKKEELSQLKSKYDDLLLEKNELFETLQNRESIIYQARQRCIYMASTKAFRAMHFLFRIKYQFLKGNKEERKCFKKWLISKTEGRGGNSERSYNPIWSVINILDEEKKCSQQNFTIPVSEYSDKTPLGKHLKTEKNCLTSEQQAMLNTKYENYDVIILGIIDYNFRYQRPQHFASRFAENGHRVYYINANHFNPDSITEIQDNLNVINLHNEKYSAIHLTDWSEQESVLHSKVDQIMNKYCIRDAIVIVDYPNWITAAEYLRKSYGFKILTDYMDDFTGFLNPAESLVRENCIRLLQTSDHIVSSSEFLYGIAKKYNANVNIIRNGTEFAHFNQAAIEYNNDRKIIGYYGAVAEWFDWAKVVYVAQNMPECDIVIIGHVTAGEKQLSKCSNIRLLGELPYSELPRYLEKFDVCLIPFDTTTDLIKATNPVKFYEYLSAGKKIVATEIPELEPFKDKYVYLENDNQKFLEYIKLCLNNKDTLLPKEEKILFALQNDWQNRYECFSKSCKQSVPKVSIIVLTYNNLKINKICIQSILHNTAYPNYELIIVDNLSTDGTREYLKEIENSDKKLKVIYNAENKGFAGGNNVGIKESEGDYVVLLNNDTIVTRGWLTAMTKHLENEADLGMCGPVTNSIGNEARIKVNYHNMEEMRSFAYHYTTEHWNEEFSNPNVLALFCTMIKREVIETCGLLDEEYGVGMFEDDDYAEAVKQKGFKLIIAEDTFIHHFEGASFKKLEDKKYREIFEQNKKRYERKWSKKWTMHKYREGVTWDINSDINLLNEN